MDPTQWQSFAGAVSTAIFVSSNVPMLFKAIRTKDLKSYSLGNLFLSNLGNLVHWVYVASLPFGPIWFLHGFYTLVTAVMLGWYFLYECDRNNMIRLSAQKINQLCACGCQKIMLACQKWCEKKSVSVTNI